jgi:predicted transposase/invertase (TIGR01784 family)
MVPATPNFLPVKTDPIFYRLFQTFPSTFFELIGRLSVDALAYEFRSVEIKQTAFRIDGVFIPVSGSNQQPILFAEVQFQKDPDFYFRLFSEITLYLRQYKPVSDWQAVVIYPTRSIEQLEPLAYRDWLALPKVQRLYLDELEVGDEPSLGVSMARLVVESEERAPEQARGLIAKAQQNIGDRMVQREIIELIETIVFYKFPKKSRQELEAMLGLGDLKETRFYQEAEQEGEQKAKFAAVPRLLQKGLTLEVISEVLELPLEDVKKAARSE